MKLNKTYLFFIFFFIAIVAYSFKKKQKTNILSKPFSNIVKNLKIRACDPKGCGYFGAKRKGHKHQGVDIVASVGQTVFAPISGSVRRLFVYAQSREMQGIEITNEDYAIKIFYLDSPLNTNSFIEKGETIGVAQNIAKYYNAEGILTNHIHFEVRKNGKIIDPTPFLV